MHQYESKSNTLHILLINTHLADFQFTTKAQFCSCSKQMFSKVRWKTVEIRHIGNSPRQE